MQQVITDEMARSITGGRKPLVPIEYENAIRELVACQTLDEAKYFSDKADALAAWAKIYHDDKASIEAKRLKLHAYRRMGEIAAELRPVVFLKKTDGGMGGQGPGPHSLLREAGFSKQKALTIRSVALVPEKEFERVLNSPNPPSPNIFIRERQAHNPEWSAVMRAFTNARTSMRKHPAETLARNLELEVAATARKLAIEMIEWLDTFEQHLPK